jgi:GNAT superfamily N-acetyltransferase
MDVRLPNGEIVTNVPEGTSKADLVAKLRAAGRDLSWLDPKPVASPAAPVVDPVAPPAEEPGLGDQFAQQTAGYPRLPGVLGAMDIGQSAANVAQNIPQFVKRSVYRRVKGLAEVPGAAAELVAKSVVGAHRPESEVVGQVVRRGVEDTLKPATEPAKDWALAKEAEAVAALTPAARRALELSLVESEEDGSLRLGAGATDPWWWTANVIDVGVQAAPGMGTTAVAARMSYAAKFRQVLGELSAKKIPQSVAIKEAQKQAMKAATRSAVIAGGLTEGALAGGQNAAETRAAIESLDEETLMAYPGYLELREQGLAHEEARERIAGDKAAAVAIATGATVSLTGAPMNAFFGRLAAKFGREAVTPASRAVTVGKAAVGEGAQEFVQEGAETAIQNTIAGPITGEGTWDNVLENAITGAALGAVVGGGFGAAGSGKNPKKTKDEPKKTKDEPKTPPKEPPTFDGPTGPQGPETAGPVEAAAFAYERANMALQRALEAARDPNQKIKYADIQKLREARNQAMVDYTRELMHSGAIAEKDQPKVADALKQAEAEGVVPTPRKPAAAGDASPERDAALQAVANAQEVDETAANDLIARGLARVNPRGVMVLTPEGRRRRKAAEERAKETEKPAQVAGDVSKNVGTSTQVPTTRKKRETLKVSQERSDIVQRREAERAERQQRPRRDLEKVRADKAVTPESIAGRAAELEASDRAHVAAGGQPTVENPQMREAFRAAAARARRARAGLPDTDAPKSTKRVAFRLKGAPEYVEIPGQGRVKVEPVKQAKEAAANYRKRKGITTPEQTEFARVDPARAKRIAQAFEEMKHEPNNPVVKRAYDAMINETVEQFDEIQKTGLKIEFIKPGQKDPYAASPRLAIEDVRKNNHLWVFPTDLGFGSDDKYAKDNPMLRDTGITVDGRRLVANDVFRIVHDYFGHVAEANGFRADGEENAWQIHARMYSPLARRAMTTETRGQNSWVNYGPYGEKNRKASSAETVYADQKIGLLPAEFSAFPGETLKFKHFSDAKDDRLDLDPERMGTGTKGAEAKRAGPKVISLYSEFGEVEPDVARGRTRYNVEIPAEDLYNASRDPQGLLAQAQVPYGLTMDDKGNMVPVGHRFDMNKFEELVRDAGYLGYHLPEAQGILKGQARIFHKYPAIRDGAEAQPERNVNVAMRAKRKATEEEVREYLTEKEREKLRKASAKRLVEIFNELPSGAELAAAAVAGQAKRGWYKRSAQALVNVFGPDAPRFTALLAALSPQTPVEWNFRNAVSVWVGWDKAGRPTERKKILAIMRDRLFPGTARVGKSNILGAWVNNTMRALTAEDPSSVVLSGPKVDSFAANLRGETERVTLDAWMANWAGVDQALFRGALKAAGDDPGMRPGYLAFAARVREAAKILSERTGETWTPAEVQETVWSWAKTLYEQADSFGALATARELVDNNELTDDLINATPDFAGLFEDPQISSLLAGTVYGPRVGRAAGQAEAPGRASGKAQAAPEDIGYLRKAADRLQARRDTRRNVEREEIAFATKNPQTETPEFKRWFGKSKMVNPDGTPMVVYHATGYGDFDAFSKAEQRKGMAGYGTYFSDADGANLYARYNQEFQADVSAQGEPKRTSVIPVYLRMENPLRAESIKTIAGMYGMKDPGAFGQSREFGGLSPDALTAIQRDGYDGVITTEHVKRNRDGSLSIVWPGTRGAIAHPVYVVFEPAQIKSAVGNSGAFDPKNPSITARMGSRPERGLPMADLQQVADRVTKELGVTAHIADTQADLPDYIQANIPEGAVVTGMFVEDPLDGSNEIWYVRENLDSKEEAYENALHEAVGHMGLRAVLGNSYHKVMQDIRKSFPEKVAWAERQNGIDVMLREARARKDFAAVRRLESLAAEELVAYAAGKVLQKRGALSQQSVWRRIVAKVRDILRNVGLLNSYSGEDIEALIYRARDYFRKPAAKRAQEINYRSKLAMAAKAQPAGAPQWLDPSEYEQQDGIRFDTVDRFVAEDDLNPHPELEGAEPLPGDVKEDIVFPPGFDTIMAGNDPFMGQTTVEAYADGQSIGYVTLSEDRVDEDGWSAEYVYVHPLYRGKGVAQRMYKAISDKLGVPARPSDIRTSAGRAMWDSFKRRKVAFRVKEASKRQIDSPEFKAWFGNSKVVDEDGTPKVLYHGTFGDFDVFDRASPDSYFGPGFYFTDAPDDASNYASLHHPDIRARVDDALDSERDAMDAHSNEAERALRRASALVRKQMDALDQIVERREAARSSGDQQAFNNAVEEENAAYEKLRDAHAAVREAERARDEADNAFMDKVRRERLGHVSEGSVLPVFLRMERPLVIGDGETQFYLEYPQTADGDTDFEAEPTGNAAALIDALMAHNLIDVVSWLQETALDGVSASRVVDKVKDALWLAGGETALLQDIFIRAGFDGVIDRYAGVRWSGFTPRGATHYTVFDSGQIKSAVGNVGTFARDDRRITFAFKQGPTGNADLDSFIKKIGQPPLTLRQRWDQFKANFRERAIVAIADPFYGIKTALETAGADLDAYMGARLSRNAAELTQTIIEYGPPIWNDGAPDIGEGLGLLDILKPLKGNVNLWLAYMTARRADRLMTEGRERLFTQDEINAALDLARTHPEFDVAREQYNRLQKQVLDFAQESGVIDPQTRALWEHADYIPFHRIIDKGQVMVPATAGGGIGKVRDQIRRLTGGRQNIGDPLENIVRNWSSLLDASLKAQAAREIVDALDGTGLVTKRGMIHPGAILPISAAAQFSQQNPQLVAALQSIGIDPARMPPQAFAGLQKMLSNPKTGENTVTVWRDGKREQWDVHDPLLMMGLQEVNPDALSPLIRGLVKLGSYPKRLVTRMITATPQFMLKNFWRDVWHTVVLGAKASGARLDVLPTDSVKGLVSTLKNDDTAKSLLAAGGSFTHGYVNAGDLEGAATVIRRAIRRGQSKGVVLDSFSKLFRFYGDLQAAAENANRVAMYREGLAKGLTRRQAAFASRDLLDFSQRGQNGVMRFLIATVPFFNARVQGLYRIGHGLKASFAAIAVRGLLMAAATAALLARNYDDERYKALTDQEKSNYWHFFDVFQEGDHFRLPKPFEIGTLFGTIPEAIGDAMFTNADDPDGVKQAAKYVGYAFEETLNLAPHPQIIWPMVELAVNKNTFTGSPILTQGDQGVLPEDQFGPGTSPTYKALADLMPAAAPEALRSPKQLEHLGRGYLGNLQDYVLMATDAAVRLARGEPAPPQKATADIPGLKDFYRTGPARNTRHINTMWELADAAAKLQGSIKRAEDQESAEGDARAEELERDNAPLLDVADDFQDAARSVIDLKKEQRQIQLDPSMTPDEKRREIDAIQEEINGIAKDVYDLRPGGKLNPSTAAELLTAPPTARATILKNNGLPATAALLESLA